MVKAFLFDFYGVFLPDAYSVWLSENNLKREGKFKEIIDLLDRDEISESEFLARLSSQVNRNVTNEELHGEAEVDRELVAYAEELHLCYTTGLLSNASKKLRSKLITLGIDNVFDHIIISGETGHAKPSKKAFQIAIDILGVKPEEIIFIDDNTVNIAAAESAEINTILFVSIDDLKDKIRRYLNRTSPLE